MAISFKRASGYMKTSAAGSQSKEIFTLPQRCRPSAWMDMTPISDTYLGYDLTIDVEETGVVSATVNSSRALASYGFPNTTAFFFV